MPVTENNFTENQDTGYQNSSNYLFRGNIEAMSNWYCFVLLIHRATKHFLSKSFKLFSNFIARILIGKSSGPPPPLYTNCSLLMWGENHRIQRKYQIVKQKTHTHEKKKKISEINGFVDSWKSGMPDSEVGLQSLTNALILLHN